MPTAWPAFGLHDDLLAWPRNIGWKIVEEGLRPPDRRELDGYEPDWIGSAHGYLLYRRSGLVA